MTGQRILVVDDEPQIVRALETTLRGAGYEVETAATGEAALARAAARAPEAVILDLVLPDRSGIEVCRELRSWTQIPIVVLSAVGDEREKVAALDAGADDYVTKPFGIEELLARLRAALRRTRPPGEPLLRIGELRLDLENRALHRDGTRIQLTPHEFALLRFLRTQRGQAAHAPDDPARGLGPRVPDGVPLPARVRLPASAQDRARPHQAAVPDHRAGSGLPPRRPGP